MLDPQQNGLILERVIENYCIMRLNDHYSFDLPATTMDQIKRFEVETTHPYSPPLCSQLSIPLLTL